MEHPVNANRSRNPFSGAKLYIDPNSNARKTAIAWRATRPSDADQMEKIAVQSQARWFNEWVGDIHAAVTGAMSAAESQGAVPVLVAYNIPDRDCGGLSGGANPSARLRATPSRSRHTRGRCSTSDSPTLPVETSGGIRHGVHWNGYAPSVAPRILLRRTDFSFQLAGST